MTKSSFLLFVSAFSLTAISAHASGDNVLYIGDSHSVNQTLHTDLKNNLGDSVSYYASCGSSASHWVSGGYKSPCGNVNASKTKPLTELQSQTNPNKVIIELGDNMFNWAGKNPRRAEGVARNAKTDIEKLVSTISKDTPCYWVGPTWGSKGSSYFKSDAAVKEMYALLHKTIGSRCTIVDCRDAVSRNSKGDGLHHHNAEANKAWASCIIENTKESNLTVPEQGETEQPATAERRLINRLDTGTTDAATRELRKKRLLEKARQESVDPTGIEN